MTTAATESKKKVYAVVRRGVKREPQDSKCRFMDETDFHLSQSGQTTIAAVVKLASELPGFVYAEWADESRHRLPAHIREMIFAYSTLSQAEHALKAVWESTQWYQCVHAAIDHAKKAEIDVWSIEWRFSIEAYDLTSQPADSHWLNNGH